MSYDDRNTPRYRLLAACYLEDDTLHLEGEEIWYLGTPNEEMEPLNDLAREKSTAYLEGLEDAARAVAAARNVPYLGRTALMEQALEHAHKEARGPIVLPASRGEVPIRPDLATPAQRMVREQKNPRKVLGSKPAPARNPKPAAVIVDTRG